MVDLGEIKSMSLSLRLLREGLTVEQALRDDHELEEQSADPGRLFVGQAPALPPTWFAFIDEFAAGPLPRLVNQSCAAVLFIEVVDGRKRRIFALSFGTGHHSLEPDSFERNFGLRVVLNAVARSNLRSVDVATLDATTFQKRIQASRDADLQGFGIDVDRDLMRLAAGSPKDGSFARSLAGKDALTLATKTSPADVAEKCKTALKLYQATDYKADFGFIDFVSPVKQKTLLDELDALAFAELQELVKGNASDLHIALPDILSPEEAPSRPMRKCRSRTTSPSFRLGISERLPTWMPCGPATRFGWWWMVKATSGESARFMTVSSTRSSTTVASMCSTRAIGTQ
jgi:uncharacterized protein (TIGR04141 family)